MRDVFEFGQRLGFDLLPRHFYSSIPDIKELRAADDWKQPHSMIGVAGAALGEQVAFLGECCDGQSDNTTATTIYDRACVANGAVGYGLIEAGFLHRFVTSKRPTRVVQIGAGVSTSVVLNAADAVSLELQLTCIDPYPTEFLRSMDRAGHISLIREKAQTVPIGRLIDLAAGDLLFVDSTHAVKPGSEVNRIILEVLPRLAPGVYVHFHDIYFPFDYAPTILGDDLFFWNETPLLHAYLVGNSSLQMRISLSMLHSARPHDLQRYFPEFKPYSAGEVQNGTVNMRRTGYFPSSVYLEVRGNESTTATDG